MWMHLLAIPLGILILIVILVMVALFAEYPLETIAIISILAFGYWLGANALGLY